jgi:CDP-diglyceride synthetase
MTSEEFVAGAIIFVALCLIIAVYKNFRPEEFIMMVIFGAIIIISAYMGMGA